MEQKRELVSRKGVWQEIPRLKHGQKKKTEKTENSTNVTCNTAKVLTYVSGVQKGEERDNGVEIILLAKIY